MRETAAEFWRQTRGYPLRAFFICLAGASLANLDQALFAFVLTEISQAFHWTVVERGWYIALTFAIAGLSITALGVLTDRIGRKKVLEACVILSSLFVAAMRWAPGTASMLALRTLGFATGGAQSPLTGTIVVEESPPRFRGLLSGVLQVGYPVGWYLASMLASFVYSRYGWRETFLIGLAALPYAFVIHRYLRETGSFLRAREHSARTGEQPRFSELFAPGLRGKTIALFFGEFLHVFAYGTTILLTAYFREYRHWEATAAIRLVGYSYAVGALGYILAAFVGEFLMPRRNTIILWSWLGSAAFAAMIWAPSNTALYYCLMTVFFYGTTAVKFTFIAENFPARLRATGVTFSGSLAVNLGVAFGPLMLSYAVERFGWSMAYTITGILPILASGFIFLGLPARPATEAEPGPAAAVETPAA